MSVTAAHPPAKAKIQQHAAEDLKSAFLFAYNHAPVTIVEVVDSCRFNTRYAREILGTLTHAELLTEENNDADGGDVWYYNEETFTKSGLADNEISAEELINNWLVEHGLTQRAAPPSPPTATSPRSSKPSKRSIPGSDCLCGCGRATKGNFAPGHDAKMAGEVARNIAKTGDMLLADQLPTPQLREKARAHARRLMEKGGDPVTTPDPKPGGLVINAPESDPTETDMERALRTGAIEPIYTYGVVKIGKNRFAARRDADGVIMRANKALPNVVISLNAYAEMDYPGTVEGNAAKSFKALEVQP